MRVSLAEIKIRPGGRRVRLEQSVEVESLYIGRGPDNDLSLQGLTTSLHHATIRMANQHAYIEAAPGQEFFVNGLPTSGERLAIGDEIHIGAWALRIQAPASGEDLRIEYERRQPADDARAALEQRTQLGIERGLFARRPLAWLGLIMIGLGFLALPLFWPGLQSVWATGPVLRGHAIIETDCASCHNGLFQRVTNDSCTTCHVDVRRHAPVASSLPELEEMACADCHVEHRGREVAIENQGADDCVDCHRDLSRRLSNGEGLDASDFGSHHPAIRLAVIEESGEPARSMAWPDEINEDPGVEFDHHFHTSQAMDGPETEEWLDCGQCHQIEENGQAMQPVQFDRHCRRCHELDAGVPEFNDDSTRSDRLIHGDPARNRAQLRRFFTQQALASREFSDPQDPAQRTQWIENQVAAADEELFEDGCALCHQILGDDASDQPGHWSARSVAPVRIQRDWIEHARFSHAAHATQACATCHPTAAVRDPDVDPTEEPQWAQLGAIPYGRIDERPGVTAAESSADIMIPGIETCRTCHASPAAGTPQRIASACSMCHDFHDHRWTPMKSRESKAEPHPSSD